MEYVQPGDVTGYYYIIVAGLPWNCSWQRLKDVCKNQQPDGTCIEIDHVHVYPGETNGWVRVKGKQNFLKMMEHLNTTAIDRKKCLVVDGRNETQILTIKTAAASQGFNPLPLRTRNDSSPSNDSYPPSTASYYGHRNKPPLFIYSRGQGWYGQPQPPLTSPMSPTYGSPTSPSVSFYQQSPQMYENTNSVSPYATADSFQPLDPSSVVYAGSMPTATPVYVPSSDLQSPNYIYHAVAPYPEIPQQPATTGGYIKPEARKIIILHLPHNTTNQQLQHLLVKYIARGMPRYSTDSPYDELLELNIVTHRGKKPRCHAFAVLKSEEVARYVVCSLDCLQFQGRELEARFAKEGVNCSTECPIPTASQAIIARAESQYQIPEATQMFPTAGERERTVACAPPVRTLVREDNKPKRESKERSRDRERKDLKKKNASTLVVNGSNGQREGKWKDYRSW